MLLVYVLLLVSLKRLSKTIAEADYAYLGRKTYTPQAMLGTAKAEREGDIFAAFSPLEDGEHFRGYVAYTTSQLQEGWYLSSGLNYTYQRDWLQYPVCNAMQWCLQRGAHNNGPFAVEQCRFLLQYSENSWEPLG